MNYTCIHSLQRQLLRLLTVRTAMNYTSTMRFIELFRQHQALWDRNHADYLNKAERMRQRELIGYTMGMTGRSFVT